jgi:pimeloyl-ACP methyl ester carboxylesterase
MATVTSQDGTTMGYDRQGEGPVIVLIDGALGYRQFGSMTRVAELLAPWFTVVTYDRRGRGESGATQPYALEREIDDIHALIMAAGGSAFLHGTSSGACLAFEAAIALGTEVGRLAMYEAPYDSEAGAERAWKQYAEQLAALLSDGRNGDAVALFMAFVGTPPEMIAGMRACEAWPKLKAVAPTLAYDRAAMGPDRKVPTDRARHLKVPALVMNATMTLPFIIDAARVLADAIPNSRHVQLEDQRHDVDPEALVPVLAEFFGQ